MTPLRNEGPAKDPHSDIDRAASDVSRLVYPAKRRKRNRRRCECASFGLGSCDVCREWGRRVAKFEGRS